MNNMVFVENDLALLISILQTARWIFPLLALILVFIIRVIAPQQWQYHQQQRIYKQIQLGAQVTTINGLTGTICNLSDHFIIIELADGRKTEIVPQAIVSVRHEKTT